MNFQREVEQKTIKRNEDDITEDEIEIAINRINKSRLLGPGNGK